MRRQLFPALRMLLVMTVVFGLAYPLAMTAISQLAFPDKADGSIIEVDGQAVGSRLVGQEFTGAEWFHSRPSASGPGASGSMVAETDEDGNEVLGPHGEPVLAAVEVDDVANNASGSSNLGPTNKDLIAAVSERAEVYREQNGLAADAEVPVDAVTASGSGVDPHISVANARLQAPRVAEERDLDLDEVLELIDAHTDARSIGFLGEPGVNVLTLNLALDADAP